ncbi:MAG: hypothetical protein RL030_1031 [Pseudomonadota bacterium]
MNHALSCRRLLLAGSLLGLLAVSGCASGPTIRSNVDPGADFTRFQTFNFMQPLSTDREGYQTFLSRDLMAAAERELVGRGLKRTETSPDLLVNFSANLDQRLRVTQTPQTNVGNFGSHRRGFYSTWPTYRTDVQQYTQGTLAVDVIDASRMQLVWEGVAVHRLTQSRADNIGPAIDQALQEMFARFPTPKK